MLIIFFSSLQYKVMEFKRYFAMVFGFNIFNILMPFSLAIDPSCDFYQEMSIGVKYYIHNLQYPNNYPPSTSCRWTGVSPKDTTIVMSCDVNIPNSYYCQSDRLVISLSGDTSLQDATNYCGNFSQTFNTKSNSLAVGLLASFQSSGGNFICSLTAMQNEVTPSNNSVNICDCGWKHETRIVGGQDTGVNEFPGMAALIDKNTFDAFCGASIISDKYAVTAAHCLLHKEVNDLGLLVGDHDLSTGDDTDKAALYKISAFKQHPDYDINTQLNDIALLKTASRIIFSFAVGPVCLPFRYSWTNFYAQPVTALGWGFLDFSGNKSNILQEVDLSIVSNRECANAITDNPVTNNQICTYAPDKDTCLSDSGGPVLWQDQETKKLHLIAIISYGVGCATVKPAVNTRVTSYLSWILSETKDAAYCIK